MCENSTPPHPLCSSPNELLAKGSWSYYFLGYTEVKGMSSVTKEGLWQRTTPQNSDCPPSDQTSFVARDLAGAKNVKTILCQPPESKSLAKNSNAPKHAVCKILKPARRSEGEPVFAKCSEAKLMLSTCTTESKAKVHDHSPGLVSFIWPASSPTDSVPPGKEAYQRGQN